MPLCCNTPLPSRARQQAVTNIFSPSLRSLSQRLLTFFLLATTLTATVVDRIAVVVGNQVITETEVQREVALTAFFNGEKPVYDPEAMRKAADRLVEQRLVRREMEMGNYPSATEEQKSQLLAETAKKFGDISGLERQLASSGLTLADLEQTLAWQLSLVHFIDLRFRPAIQVTAEDVQDYFRTHILPRQKPGETLRLADFRQQIFRTLSAERADQQLDEWLKHAKSITRIEYKKAVFP